MHEHLEHAVDGRTLLLAYLGNYYLHGNHYLHRKFEHLEYVVDGRVKNVAALVNRQRIRHLYGHSSSNCVDVSYLGLRLVTGQVTGQELNKVRSKRDLAQQ